MSKRAIYSRVWLFTFFIFTVYSIGLLSDTQTAEKDILKMRGIKVTGGAAPGYVEDRVCAMCHNEKYRSYQKVGMARSFYRPRADKFIENFKENRFYHKPSKRYYEITPQGDQLIFKRYQLDKNNIPINKFKKKIDWIMGSGNHSRVYIYQTKEGELYQLPLSWYTRTQSWGMAPGYDNPSHMGVSRRIRNECMFCHNAYPDIAEGSDYYEGDQRFPKNLPQGTGCQRCHGPGANHVRTIFSGEIDPEIIHKTITNPKKLSPDLRNDICYQCHLQPSVALFGVRRFDRTDYSFRPGQRLSDYLLHLDIKEEGKEKIERFEINHHPYRLMQSRCFIESKGKLSCLTCHDPHRKVPSQEREEHYRNACLQCHKAEHCKRKINSGKTPGPGDCVSCHMPERRTQDVIRVVMTDHLIQRQAPSEKIRLAPLKETLPTITDTFFLNPTQAPSGDLGDMYRVIAVLRAGGGAHVLDKLESLLKKSKPTELMPYLDLARGQLNRRRFAEAEQTINFILTQNPKQKKAKQWLGIALSGQNKIDKAIDVFKKNITEGNPGIETMYNLGRILLGAGQTQEAIKYLKQAKERRPVLTPAWYHLGNAQAKLSLDIEAIQSYKHALAIDPTDTRSYLAIGHILIKKGNHLEALRYWRFGKKIATDPEPIVKALAQYETTPKK